MYASAAIYGVSSSDIQHVGVTTCNTMPQATLFSPLSHKQENISCAENFERFYAPLMRYPYLEPPHVDMCFPAFIIGQEGVFSYAGDELLDRGPITRTMRARLHASLGVPMDEPPPAAHHILVWEKTPAYALSTYPNLCDDVTSWAAIIDASLTVLCIEPASLSVAEQLRHVARATVVFSEHGSTTYSLPCSTSPGRLW